MFKARGIIVDVPLLLRRDGNFLDFCFVDDIVLEGNYETVFK